MNSIKRTISNIAGMALIVALATSASAQPQPENALHFRNGDLLYGELLAIDAPNAVRWQLPDAATPIEFRPDSIAQIDFPTSTNSIALTNNACRLLLANGDLLEGSLVSCDHDALVLETWFAGSLNIPRTSLQSVGFISHSPAIFDGITGLDGWTQGAAAAAFPAESGQWNYHKDAFYADKPASIARDLKLPDVAEIQFDLAWKGSLNFAVALYTDSLQPILLQGNGPGAAGFGGFYSLRIWNSAVALWPVKKNDNYLRLGQVPVLSLMNKDRLHVDLRISKPQHKIALFLDDMPVKEWDDPEGFIGEGTGMRFVQNPGGVIKLSNLRITQWDGIFADETTTDTTHDAFWPEKGAKVSGDIQFIANGKMTVRTTNGPVEIPLEQLKTIEFAQRQTAPPQTQAANVHATFAQGGNLTFILESWRTNEMIIRSPDFGKARINPAAFSRLEFLYPETKPAEGPKE
jgi:hypothetical protein